MKCIRKFGFGADGKAHQIERVSNTVVDKMIAEGKLPEKGKSSKDTEYHFVNKTAWKSQERKLK